MTQNSKEKPGGVAKSLGMVGPIGETSPRGAEGPLWKNAGLGWLVSSICQEEPDKGSSVKYPGF